MESHIHKLNITVDTNDLKNSLKKLLTEVKPDWIEDLVHFQDSGIAFNAGLVNLMTVCYRKKDDVKDAVMCRVYRNMKIGNLFVRKYEAQVMQIVHERFGFTPNVLATFKNGFCYEYVEGEVMSRGSMKIDENWGIIAKQLALLHSIKSNDCLKHKAKVLDLFDMLIQIYPESLPNAEDKEKFKTFLPTKLVLQEEYKLVTEELANVGSENVLIHGDTRPENFVWNKETGQIIFVDWECSGFGPQAYDIANYFLRYAGLGATDFSQCPDKDLQFKFLRVYLETYFSITKPNTVLQNSDVHKFYIQVQKYSLLVLIYNTALISCNDLLDMHSTDFLSPSIAYYNEYKRVKEEILALQCVS